MAVSRQFEQELMALINRHSMENGSDTPDFLLARYLVACLETFHSIVMRREEWYGRTTQGVQANAPEGDGTL